jgi:raffinose/stachyose/melibiose transport system substrate-binding protein
MNASQPTSINPKKLNPGNEAWLTYIAKHYGDEAMRQKGQVTGFVVHKLPKNLSPATKMVVQQLANAKNPVLWFEALMSAKATTVSQQDAAPLVTGQMSAQAFMSAVQQAIAG